MAVYMESPRCPHCGEEYEAVYTDKGKDFVGDTFLKWNWESHKCNIEATMDKAVKSRCETCNDEHYTVGQNGVVEDCGNLLCKFRGKPQKPFESITVSKEQLTEILDAEVLDINGTKYVRKDMAFRILEKWIQDKHKPDVLKLLELIKEIEDKWISASHYWGSETNIKTDQLRKEFSNL